MRYRETLIFVALIAVVCLVAYRAYTRLQTETPLPPANSVDIAWTYKDGDWSSSTVPPVCSEPLFDVRPFDTSSLRTVAEEKPYVRLGFNTSSITLRLPMDATLISVSREADGSYALNFLNSCGIVQQYAGLQVVTSRLQAYLDANQQGGSLDSPLPDGPKLVAGEAIASGVRNAEFALAVLDLRSPANGKPVCWVELLPAMDAEQLAAKAGGLDKYCK